MDPSRNLLQLPTNTWNALKCKKCQRDSTWLRLCQQFEMIYGTCFYLHNIKYLPWLGTFCLRRVSVLHCWCYWLLPIDIKISICKIFNNSNNSWRNTANIAQKLNCRKSLLFKDCFVHLLVIDKYSLRCCRVSASLSHPTLFTQYIKAFGQVQL